MPIPEVFSGIVQMAQPSVRNELFQTKGGSELLAGDDIQLAILDQASPLAIPAVPTTEEPYDGFVAFGVFITDEDLSG